MSRPQADADELIVDNFAGGGGASTGIEMALGRSPDIAINHDPEAIAMHAANHPNTRHLWGSVWDVDPKSVTGGRRVSLAWFSPDCTFHSKARGGKPFRDRNRARRRRGLAWVVIRWAKAVKPRVIILENVEEFADWAPLMSDGLPDPARRGFTFRRWVKQLENAGYRVESRELRACDYGAPTTRKRLFIIARCDGWPIEWPEPTHGPTATAPTLFDSGLLPYRTAAECIDWSIPCPSIFERERPLAENTLRRIARGLRKYVIEAAEPFILPATHGSWSDGPDMRTNSIHEPIRTITTLGAQYHLVSPYLARTGQTGGNGMYANDCRDPLTTVTTKAEHLLVSPTLIQTGWGEREGQAPRALDIHKPLGTVMADGQKHALVAAFLAKHYGGPHEGVNAVDLAEQFGTVTATDHHALVASHLLKLRGGLADHRATAQDHRAPAPTLTAGGTHLAEVRAFLIKYFGTDGDPRLTDPLHTVTTKDRFGLVTVHGEDYAIADIGMRMLAPRELFRAQGFPDRYVIDPVVNGKPLTKTAQVRMCGNSVSPPIAAALVAANVGAAVEGATA